MLSRKFLLSVIVALGISCIVTCGRIPTAKGIIWIEGHITSDTTWTPVDTYRVIDDTYVDSGVTLTIKPSVRIEFADGFSLIVEGSLNASGTEANPILLTSSRVAKDPPDPYLGAWNTITFSGNTGEFFFLSHGIIRYAKNGISLGGTGKTIVRASKIHFCLDSAVIVKNALNTTIEKATFVENSRGLTIEGGSGITVVGNNISSNIEDGVSVIYSHWGSTPHSFNSEISNNTIYLNKNGVFLLARFQGHFKDVTISKNRIFSNSENGIYLKSIGDWGMYSGGMPSSIQNVSISANTISNNGHDGIFLDAITYLSEHGIGSSDIFNIVISENKISSNINGIHLERHYSPDEVPGNNYGRIFNVSALNNFVFDNIYGVLSESVWSIWDVVPRVEIHGAYNNIYQNFYGMNVTGWVNGTVEYNYWGDSTGPYHVSVNPAGEGNPVNCDGTDLDFIPFLTSPIGTINKRPVAILEVDKTSPNVDETVNFDASGSTDDGRIDYYFFDFGDGTNSSWTPLSVVTHKYASEATYNATLIVMDDLGVTSLDGKLVYMIVTVIPEFPSILVLPLFMIATLLAVIVYRRKRLV